MFIAERPNRDARQRSAVSSVHLITFLSGLTRLYPQDLKPES